MRWLPSRSSARRRGAWSQARRAGAWLSAARAGTVLAWAALLLSVPAGLAQAAPAASVTPASSPKPAVMILLDTNYSLSGVGAAVRSAATAYIDALPPDVLVGLAIFSNDDSQIVLRPTTDRTRILSAVAHSKVALDAPQSYYSSTGIYNALAGASSALLGRNPVRILVLSDAENLAGAIPSSAIPTDVAAWNIDSDDYLSKLQQLAHTSGGRYTTPGAVAQLATGAFPPAPPSPATSPAKARASRHVSAIVTAGQPGTPWVLFGGVAAVFAALFAIALVVFGGITRRGQSQDLAGRFEKYGPRRKQLRPEVENVTQESRRASGVAVSAANRLMTPTVRDGLSKRLDLAGLNREPGEWAVLGGVAGLVIAVVLGLVTSYVVIGILGGAILGWLTMRFILSFLILRRRATFSDQLPDVLQLVASSLQAGFSLPQAFDAVVREGNQPAAGELARALAETRLGANLDDGLEAVANRMNSDDLRWTVMAIRIQQGVGGNLAEVLLTIVATIRERAFLRRQVKSLSAEGRLSAYVLIALPIAVGAFLFFESRSYMRPLYATHLGLFLLALAVGLLVLGSAVMRRIIKIEV